MTRRDDREYREYLREEQRSQRGCIAGRMQLEFRHGLLTDDRALLLANRVAILALALVPVWFAVHDVPLVQFIVLFQAKLVASFFFAPIVIGLNWAHGSAAGALASMLTGLVVCVWWSLLTRPPFGLDAIFPGVAATIIVFVSVSLATRAARPATVS